ncbi:MAG: saccharopine dehydrogenase C-terminal domain-containing protein [Candidatus Saccharicenans sp.]|nr:saccharopine dehydrogenase C-terminal domain-containing protein [Candidatus Saccharicenans sp.]
MKIAILGAGLVGKAMARDLVSEPEFKVTTIDLNKDALSELASVGVMVVQADLSQPEIIKQAIKNQDLVLNALPGNLGYQSLRSCLEAGKNVVDIAFFPEDPFELEPLAIHNNLTAVVDCGVAPGLSHILAGYSQNYLDKRLSLVIYVGGLPAIRKWPLEYKAVFSPLDVLEEYLRPARLKENGQIMTRPALSDPEFLEFKSLGTLEAFNTDGLRTLLHTLDIPEMKEKTLRYPGHREKMLILREAGFFDSKPLRINGQEIRPLEVTAKVMFSKLSLEPGEEDLTVMRVLVDGEKEGRPARLTFDLLDRFDQKSGVHSMARTTGYTATMVVRALASGLVKRKGIVAPEFLGTDERVCSFILQGLKDKGISIQERLEVF